MRRLIALPWLLLFALTATAETKIDGPTSVAVSQPAWFTVGGMESGDRSVWFPSPQLQTDSRYIKEGVSLFWSDKPGKFQINVMVVDCSKNKFIPLSETIAVGSDPGPDPIPPGPDPPDPDPPPTPDPLTGLALLAYDWALSETPTVKRVEYATGLAGSFSGMAAKIAAGTVSKPQDIIDQTTAANRAAIGVAGRAAWLPWFERLRVYLNAESKAGRLVTPEHYAMAWREIADGLEVVR